MKLNKALANVHSLKKSSYTILKKLHRLEHRGALRTCANVGGKPYVILCLQHMAEVFKECFQNDISFRPMVDDLCDRIILLRNQSSSRGRIDRTILVSCLKAHTRILGLMDESKCKMIVTQTAVDGWHIKVLGAYIAQFGNRI